MEIKRFSFYLAILALGFVLVSKAVQASVGVNATETTFQERYTFSVLLPEGWGFFTKSPRDEKNVLYRIRPDKSLEVATHKNADPENLFGFSRRSRRANMEFSRVMAQVKEKDWDQYQRYSLQDLIGSDTIATVHIPYSSTQFNQLQKGTYIVKRYTITPWAWAQYPEHYTNPERYLKLTIN
ncbi:SdpA family antimicrobial peptide system protein [Hymenobacter chitinivorans]|uniref:Antimicrobial peptide system SdpA family protein n=1 Tax=Hymenobacter chitinivorans DSM 11115 TaxID=1121954 RepID=A0A2M9BMM9_9BACT|nr:SdpA family antimicrobial peptide system protein [Hymenobacter chitinivorans]PJJ59214.1 antimicrobial peptide system SdpA family protein [Hymenobacter chitinivorans DSM 11115]